MKIQRIANIVSEDGNAAMENVVQENAVHMITNVTYFAKNKSIFPNFHTVPQSITKLCPGLDHDRLRRVTLLLVLVDTYNYAYVGKLHS